MCRTGMYRFGVGNWIFLLACIHLFTCAKGGDEHSESGVRMTAEPSDAVAAAGDRVVLACAAAAPARVSWRHSATAPPTRDHTLSMSDSFRKQLANGSLVIESMSSALAGQYQCVATQDGVGTIVSRIATVFLAELPEIVETVRTVSGALGAGALLPCTLKASPRLALRVAPAAPERRVYGAAGKTHTQPPVLKLNVTWMKNGSPVRMESARISLTPSGALELEPLRPHDAAVYRCLVALAHAPAKHVAGPEIDLRINTDLSNVETPPRFIAVPQPVTVIEGASVTFDCAAIGNPKPEMIWLNNGVAIDLNDLDSRFYLVGSGSLRVQSARALDAGVYTCRAHNRLDSTDHSTQLQVLSAPRVTLPGGALARAFPRGDVTLRCEARGRPAPAVAWLKDGETLTPNSRDIALLDGASLRIQGVLGVDAGMFQCAATSAAGSAVAALRLLVAPPDDDSNTSRTQNTAYPSNAYFPNSTHDIFNSLVSGPDSTLEPTPEDLDFLGETSSAYTSGPDVEYDEYDNSFHATEGLDLDELGQGNATVVSAPKALRAVIVKHRFVTLSWEEPEKKLEEVTGYAVVYKVKGSERERIARGNPQRHEMNVASLQPNTTYQFSVMAFTQHSHSPASETIEATTAEEELTYGPPEEVRVEALGPHSARVWWVPPAHAHAHAALPSSAPPTRYAVYYTDEETGREQTQWSESTSATLSGLRAATAYRIRVAAAGGAPSQELRTKTPQDAPAAPPANVTAVASGATSVVVRWEAPPPRTHRGPLTGYKVRYRGAGTNARRRAGSLTTPADARRADLRGLDAATVYQVRVCAINANGSGPFSEWVTVTTQAREHGEARVPAPPPKLTTRAGRDWISVWWGGEGEGGGGAGAEEGGALVRGYWLGWGLGVPDDRSHELPAHLRSYVIRNLESNSEYVISLRAGNALGLGPAVYATVRTRPAQAPDDEPDAEEPDEPDADDDVEDDQPPLIPPVGLKVIMLSGTTAVVYWTDPTLPKGQTATDGRRYVVRWATSGGRARTYNASDLNCMLDDLRPYTTYEFAVKLIKGGRESAWSMLVSNTTLEAAPGTAPRELRVSPAAPPARAADLTWAPPLKPNGPLTGYVIMYAIQRSGSAGVSGAPEEWTAVAVLGDRTRSRVDRLRPRTTYIFKLQARNSKGLGPFSAPVVYTTAMETGEGGGLASATSAWLWASAGGACAVLALAAALALSLCCRRHSPPMSPDTSTYQKASASAAIKPPDLWIHHDQMELKHMDKSLHSSASKISAGSVDGPNALVSSTLTLGRAPAAEYEPARHAPPPASLDRRHYVPTYVDSRRSPSRATSGSDDTAVLRASPAPASASVSTSAPACASASACRRCDRADYWTMTGVGVGVGVGCAATCERRRHGLPDQSTPLLAGVAPLGSPQSSLASLGPHQSLPHHPPPAPCGSGTCPLGAACSVPSGAGSAGSDVYACAARERGHYVAYEPLGHYTHRDSLSSDAGVGAGVGGGGGIGGSGAGGGSLQRRAACAPPMHSFTLSADGSDHSTPSHSKAGSVRETSPYKKSASSSPGHIPNRLQLAIQETWLNPGCHFRDLGYSCLRDDRNDGYAGVGVPHCSEELEPLTPSRSTERLHREMQNLEGLMKDLSAITQQQFHC